MASKTGKGNVLRVDHGMDGLTRVVLDNGAVNTINLVLLTEAYQVLPEIDTERLADMLSVRPPGGYKPKGTNKVKG